MRPWINIVELLSLCRTRLGSNPSLPTDSVSDSGKAEKTSIGFIHWWLSPIDLNKWVPKKKSAPRDTSFPSGCFTVPWACLWVHSEENKDGLCAPLWGERMQVASTAMRRIFWRVPDVQLGRAVNLILKGVLSEMLLFSSMLLCFDVPLCSVFSITAQSTRDGKFL